MARISEHIIEQVRQNADIHDVVSNYVELKKRGRNFFGLCPFHNEKTPSFSINVDKQIYKCFGCGKGGGTINFIMDVERLDFVDAIKYLGNKYNIKVEIEHQSKSSQDLFNQLYLLHDIANKYYKNNLNDEIVTLLKNRNIKQASIEKFEIGLALNDRDSFLKLVRNEKLKSDSLKNSGLFIDHEKGYLDRFRDRIMLPIYNHFNKIIAFSGRIYSKQNKSMAKYLNSPESPIYNKRKILYGMNINKNDIIDSKSVIIVEGYFDLIQLYQENIKNVLAVSGTAFTNQHATAISKLCKKIYIAYDGDNAGVEAAIRAGYIVLKNSLDAKIITIPNGWDPDDWIQKEGAEPFQKAIQNAVSLLKFHYQNESKKFNDERDKIEFINTVIIELIDIKNVLDVELLVKELSELTGYSIDNIFNTIEQTKTKRQKYKRSRNQESEINTKSESISVVEKEFIMFCFSKELKHRELIKKHLNTNWLQSNMIKKIYEEIYMHLSSKNLVEPEIIMNELKNERERDLMAELIFKNIQINEKMIIDCLIRLEKNILQNELNELRNKLKQNMPDDDSTKIIKEINDMQKEKNNLHNKYVDA